MDQYDILWIVISFGVGGLIAFLLKGKMMAHRVKAARTEAEKVIKDAQRASDTLIKEAKLEVKDRLFKMKSDFDRETKETRLELQKREKRLLQKEEHIDQKIDLFDKREKEFFRQLI